MSDTPSSDKIEFVDYYQTPLNAGTYEVTAELTPPNVLSKAIQQFASKVQLHVAGPRYILPPSEVHSVFPPENGEGDYNNVLPHVVLNRRTLPWERLVDGKKGDKASEERDKKLEQIPFLALLVFSEDEENRGDVSPPIVVSLADLGGTLEPGEKPTDKVSVIDVKSSLIDRIMPTGEEMRLLAHGRVRTKNAEANSRSVVIANRLPKPEGRCVAHLVMLENRYNDKTGKFKFDAESEDTVRLVSLKSWQFNCSTDEPTLRGRLLAGDFTFDTFCVPPPKLNNSQTFQTLRALSYAALPYRLRWGDRTHTLYHGPLVAAEASDAGLGNDAPASADGLVRILEDQRIFDVSLAAAWQLGRLLMLRDQSVAMEYYTWRRRDAQHHAQGNEWEKDGHLHLGDDHRTGLSPMPTAVHEWCRERLELRGLPFEYLVPDARMLPEDSLRVFRIHEGWMQCLLSGALAVGRSGEGDRPLEGKYLQMFDTNDTLSCKRTGFLLRSPAVDEHPDLAVAALDTDNTSLPEVRLERIGPGLLLGLYNGTISKLQFSLPPIGLHFGLKEVNGRFAKDVKNEATGKETGDNVEAHFRGERVLAVSKLCGDLESKLKVKQTPGRFAFQMCEGTELVEFELRAKPQIL